MSKSNLQFPVGKVVGFQGLKGEVKVRPWTNNPLLLLDIKEVEITLPDGLTLKASVSSLRLERRLLIFKFKEYTDRTAAEALIDAELFANRNTLRKLDSNEWWIGDLLGLEVYTTDGGLLGTVCDIVDAGNQWLEILPAQTQSAIPHPKTILVPFVEALVPLVDLNSRRIEVVNLPGLLEPQ